MKKIHEVTYKMFISTFIFAITVVIMSALI